MPFPPLIAPRCPEFPALNLDGVLCETFEAERNGQASFQWSRFPIGVETNDGADTSASDPDLPLLGTGFYYQIRAENACPSGPGSLGADSSGIFRRARECP